MSSYVKNLVSVIIPSYNSARYLEKAINSVLFQTYPYVEIIVIDDGSVDNTYEALLPYKGRIRYRHKENGGPASARNLGLNLAKGEYIAFLDADDYWLPEKLKIQIDFMRSNPGIDLVHANSWIDDGNSELYPIFVHDKPPSGEIFQQLFLSNHICILTVVVRHECMNQNRFDERNGLIGCEDYELWLRISLNHKIAYVDETVAVYRIHNTNISSEIKNIKGQLLILENIYLPQKKEIDKIFPGIIKEKYKRVYFRWACYLLEYGFYKDPIHKFISCLRWRYSPMKSLLGILCCVFKKNIFFQSRRKSIFYNKHAYFLLSKKKYKKARDYFLMSFKHYPLQPKIIFKILSIREPKI